MLCMMGLIPLVYLFPVLSGILTQGGRPAFCRRIESPDGFAPGPNSDTGHANASQSVGMPGTASAAGNHHW